MNKQNMYNEYEAITPQAQEDFKDIESHINDCVRSMSNKYKTIDIEHYLQQLVSTTCSEKRLRLAMDMKLNLKKEKQNKCKHEIVFESDGVTAFGGKYWCPKCGYIESCEDGR